MQEDLTEEVEIAVDRMLHWLDVYTRTRSSTITPSIEFQRAVMDAALMKADEGIKKQLEQYEAEEVARVKRREEVEKSNDPKKGWWIHTLSPRMGVNWHLLERFEQEKFKNPKRLFLYRKQRSELMCDCKGRDGSSCGTCYGTGFDGGWVFAGPFPAVGVRKEAEPDTETDGRLLGAMHFQVSLFRRIIPGDVVVDEDGVRWRVLRVEGGWNQNYQYGWLVHAFTVHPTLGQAKFPLTHNEKKMEKEVDAE